MKEYKIITLTPTTDSKVRSMEGYVKSCEATLNKLAKQGWQLVCTESIPQQEKANLIVFLEREVSAKNAKLEKAETEVPETLAKNAEAFIEHPNPVKLPRN